MFENIKPIICIGKDNLETNFKYWHEKEPNEYGDIWKISVVDDAENYMNIASYRAEEIENNQLKMTMMNNHNSATFSAKGIPEKIIDELAKISKKTVISSTNKLTAKSIDSEYRTGEATKVWERLVSENKATYDSDSDIYTYIE
jgi:hypothetical protein